MLVALISLDSMSRCTNKVKKSVAYQFPTRLKKLFQLLGASLGTLIWSIIKGKPTGILSRIPCFTIISHTRNRFSLMAFIFLFQNLHFLVLINLVSLSTSQHDTEEKRRTLTSFWDHSYFTIPEVGVG